MEPGRKREKAHTPAEAGVSDLSTTDFQSVWILGDMPHAG